MKRQLQEERDNVRRLALEHETTLKDALKQTEELGRERANALQSLAAAESRAAVAEVFLLRTYAYFVVFARLLKLSYSFFHPEPLFQYGRSFKIRKNKGILSDLTCSLATFTALIMLRFLCSSSLSDGGGKLVSSDLLF